MALASLAIVAAVGCSKPAAGTDDGPCYPNDTCNAGLSCVAGTCKPFSDVDASGPDLAGADLAGVDLAGPDAARLDDAGMPCPGATILHPGTETRMAGTSVPFVGRGRDPSCAPITGANLVWTVSVDGNIGTGEMFNHTFNTTGSHTVTLAAKDGAATYTAMITFMIN
jgi:hypothetical protein